MAGNKSKLSKLDREEFLREHGFEFFRQGKGDHTVWGHPELMELAKTHKIECPPNLLSNVAQAAWEHAIPDNPAGGTWHKIAKHAEWCAETVAKIKGASLAEERQRKIKQEFREARQEICDWKRDTKHRLRAGLDTKPAPVSYHQINDLKARL